MISTPSAKITPIFLSIPPTKLNFRGDKYSGILFEWFIVKDGKLKVNWPKPERYFVTLSLSISTSYIPNDRVDSKGCELLLRTMTGKPSLSCLLRLDTSKL